MNEGEKRHILTNLSELVNKTSWRTSCKTIPIEKFVFGDDDVAELESIPNERERIYKFYEIFLKKKNSYQQLIATLEAGCQSGAVEILNEFDVNSAVAGTSTGQIPMGVKFDVVRPVRLFTGRLKELTSLHEKLQQSKSKQIRISQIAAIAGLGGIGKTELARMYIQEFGEHYDNNVIWISAETEETLRESFQRLATDYLKISLLNVDGEDKHIKSQVEEVYKFFEGKLCLFVFDNAESNENIIKFMPLQAPDPPYVLITSRDKDWKFSVEMIELNEMTELEAVEFGKHGLEIKDEKQDHVVLQLVKILQCFPLAISQAISYIKQQQIIKNYGICEYLEEYKSCLKKLLCYKVPSAELNSYAKTTFTTWKMTVDLLSKNNECGKVAVCLLNIIAYFESDKIPTKLLLACNLDTLQFAGVSEPGILSRVAELFGLSKIVGSFKSPSSALNFCEKIEKALQLLAKYSLINLQPSDQTISIHRLVQEVTRIELREKKLEEVTLKNALRLLSENRHLKTISHFCSTYKYCGEYRKIVVDFKQVPSRVMEELDDDVSSGRYSAVRIGNELKKTLLNHVSLKDNDVARLESMIAIANYRVGNFEIAAKCFEQILPTYMEDKSMFTKTEILNVQCFLAGCFKELEKRTDSLKLLLDTYKGAQTLYGGNGWVTIQVLIQVSECLQQLGHFKKPFAENIGNTQEFILSEPQEIISLLKGAYESNKHLISSHPNHAGNMHEIASFFNDIGDNVTASTIATYVYEQGRDSNNTMVQIESIRCLNLLGVLKEIEGKYGEALSIFREAHAFSSNKLGDIHLDTLMYKANMLEMLGSVGEGETALSELREVLETFVTSYPNHPCRFSTELSIGVTLFNLKRRAESLSLFVDIRKRIEDRYGQTYPLLSKVTDWIRKFQNLGHE